MAETISIHLPDLADVATLNLFLHRTDDGALLNAAGDLLVHSVGGRFTATLTEDRAGLGVLSAVVCDGAESPANVVWDGWLAEGQSTVNDTYPQAGGGGGGDATLAKQNQILASVAAVNSNVNSLGSSSTEAY